MFEMTTVVVTALKSAITRFVRDDIPKMEGKNAFFATKQLTAVTKSLACVDTLGDEVVHDFVDRLSKGSVLKFTKAFKLESAMYHSVKTFTTYSDGSQQLVMKDTDLYGKFQVFNPFVPRPLHVPHKIKSSGFCTII